MKNLATLVKDKNKPLFNRAIQGTYPPGSIFKLINGLIALQEGTIRKMYGLSIDKNSVHGSDSVENAKKEIDFFFKND